MIDGMTQGACEGDTTTGGGLVLQGTPGLVLGSRKATFKGALVRCDVHGLTHVADATMPVSVHGKDIAGHGDLLACGHRLVALGDSLFEASSGRNDTTRNDSPVFRSDDPESSHGFPSRPSNPHSYAHWLRLTDAATGKPIVNRRCFVTIGDEKGEVTLDLNGYIVIRTADEALCDVHVTFDAPKGFLVPQGS
jgi:uncharacterized Zn-binding protein involved in type VI secretion